ncbi:unnamed protein product [Strongylus vulgaris]|uniref:Uncharacterized protein n=1 Tax=Strongylus vulgaris TaxID=40348 RepID=A0A3P7JIQ9_STRVU|nr:unnamed protein product [Strongylus vulgaris]
MMNLYGVVSDDLSLANGILAKEQYGPTDVGANYLQSLGHQQTFSCEELPETLCMLVNSQQSLHKEAVGIAIE